MQSLLFKFDFMETVNINTSQHVDIDYPVAGLGERVAARMIDLAAFFILYILFILVSIFTTSINNSPIFFFTVIGIYVALYISYNLLCEIFMDGQSLGKKVMKIKVISIDGGQASIGQYLIRWVFRIVDFALTMQVGGLICVALSDKKQRMGDMVAGTTLIKTIPHTTFEHIAFRPATEAYNPVFTHVDQLTDRDLELVHEVISTYYRTQNPDIVYTMAEKIAKHLSIKLPEGMNALDFLKTVAKDYNYITSKSE